MNLVKLEELASIVLLCSIFIILMYYIIGRITVKLMIEYKDYAEHVYLLTESRLIASDLAEVV